MAEIKRTQAELDEIFAKMERDYLRLNERQQRYAIREMGRIRGEITEYLAEYADDKGVITRRRLSRVLSDLDEIEQSIREQREIVTNRIIVEAVVCTAKADEGATDLS